MASRLFPSARFPTLVTLAVASLFMLSTRPGAPAPSPKHGLTGSYYVSNWDKDVPPPAGPYAQVWHDPNDFWLPKMFTAPVATRVDAQVAFGQGKGFSATNSGPPIIWWPTASALPVGWTDTKNVWNYFAAVIWKGYIHLPKAGTYYFGTVCNGGSAVYLNQARVALNGNYGGVLVNDIFTYAREEVQDLVQNVRSESILSQSDPRYQYLVPVSIDAPRDLPIEVYYNPTQHFTHWASDPIGIDLFWVTPDSPRDDKGKPIASIVPSDALYTDPPGNIEKPAVRSANSTISADFLYFPTQYAEGAVTLTIRLADKDGNPVADKRVYVNSLNEWNPDAIVQPDKPTDKNGETTAKIRANANYSVAHDSAIFATDVTDLVDVAQVAHVTFQQVDWNFFEPFSPYDDRHFSVTPEPPVVGRPATIKTELKNHSKFPAKVTVTFLTTDVNIGLGNWVEIAKVNDITLQPGESKEVSTIFTPKEVVGHKCYKVEVEGKYIANNSSDGKVFAAALLPFASLETTALASPPDQSAGYSTQINTSTVEPEPCLPQKRYPWIGEPYWVTNYKSGPGNTIVCDSDKNYWFGVEHAAQQEQYICRAVVPTTVAGTGTTWIFRLGKGAGAASIVLSGSAIVCSLTVVYAGIAHYMEFDPPDPDYREVYVPSNYQLQTLGLETVPQAYQTYAAGLEAIVRNQLEIISLSTAVLVSLERYRGAMAARDQHDADLHLTAYANYTNQVAQRFQRGATLLENLAAAMRTSGINDVVVTADQIRSLQQQLSNNGLPQDMLPLLAALDISKEFVSKDIMPALSDVDPNKAAGSYHDELIQLAAIYRQAGAGLARKGQATYVLSNPHEKQETIDLFIRPISIPPDWKVSVVNTEHVTAQGQTPANVAPQYPVREIEPGRHYSVTLPAKGRASISSTIVPVGDLGVRTTARWAVEGKIGDELVGGMVHEVNAASVAGIQLPRVREVEEELPVPSRNWARIAAEIAAGIVILGLPAYFFIFWRRRRRTTAT